MKWKGRQWRVVSRSHKYDATIFDMMVAPPLSLGAMYATYLNSLYNTTTTETSHVLSLFETSLLEGHY